MRGTMKAGVVALAATLAAGCGGSSSSVKMTSSATGFFVTISNMSFTPLDLRVPPGATVTVINKDAMEHSVTSEASPNAFTPGAANGVSFDTGAFTGERTFTIPSNAPNGAVIPYFCVVHTSTMATPNGSITIDSSAQPTAPPGGTTSGGGGGGLGY